MDLKFILVLLSIFAGTFADIYTYEDSDTIFIEAENEVQDEEMSSGEADVPDVYRTKRQFFQVPGFIQFLPQVINPPVQEKVMKNAPCVARSGAQGKCKKLTECYKFIPPPEDGRNDTNHLAVFITENTGFCDQVLFNGYDKFNQKPEVYVDLFESQICCPTETRRGSSGITTRPRPPPGEKPAGKPENTGSGVEQGECGMRKVSVMGQSATSGKVTGPGEPAEHGRYPWAAALRINDFQMCGATIIGKQHLVTAAHCIAELTPAQFAKMNVLIGDNNIYVEEGHEVVRKITKAFYHKNYDNQLITNDVAVLKMESPIEYTDFVQPICLAKESVPVGPSKAEYATVCGWGKTCEECSTSNVLRYAVQRIYPQPECMRAYSGIHPIGDGMVCAGAPPKDSCYGDSGGPLMYYRNQEYFEQIGIVSFGLGCGKKPGVYTRVEKYLDWIDRNTKN